MLLYAMFSVCMQRQLWEKRQKMNFTLQVATKTKASRCVDLRPNIYTLTFYNLELKNIFLRERKKLLWPLGHFQQVSNNRFAAH